MVFKCRGGAVREQYRSRKVVARKKVPGLVGKKRRKGGLNENTDPLGGKTAFAYKSGILQLGGVST